MSRFQDIYLNDRIVGYPTEVAPNFSTQIVMVDSGSEQANARWSEPLRDINIPQGVRDQTTFNDLLDHWLVSRGPLKTWPFRDPTDFASCPLEVINQEPTLSRADQEIGTGDGVTTDFQLVKQYTRGGYTHDRTIHFPVVASVLVGIDGVDPADLSPALAWSVSRLGGVVHFNTPPPNGAVITAGFLFDLQVRFQDDNTFRGIMRTYSVNGFADIPLQEVRYCQD